MLSRKRAVIAGVLLCVGMFSASIVAAQDDNSPIQVGYVVVTPTSANTSGLVVFETFGQKRGNETTQAGVLPSDVTTDAVMFVSTSGRLSRDLGVAIANPNAIDATIRLTLRSQDGTVLGTKDITVAGKNQRARFVNELFSGQAGVPQDFDGTLTIHSSVPVGVVGLRFRGENFSTIPITSLAAPVAVPEVAPGVGGAHAVILAQFATGGGWSSEIVLANTSATPLTVRVDIFGQNGLPLAATLNNQRQSTFENVTIPGGGVVVLAPRDNHGDSGF